MLGMEIGSFDLKLLLGHFRDVGEHCWGMVLDTDKLEKVFTPIKDGREELSLGLIERIKEDYAFPAWWRLPQLDGSEFEGLEQAFSKMGPRDEKIIGELFDVIKNIEIVSCILRFIDPEHYAIFSAPVEHLLNIRGKDQINKYLNYLGVLEEIGEVYGFTRIADVDHAIWALANIINSDQLRNISPYDQFNSEYQSQPNIIKTIAAKNSLAQIWSESPLYIDLARIFVEEDPILGGLIASREFEYLIKQLCRLSGVKLAYRTVNGIHWLYVPELTEQLRIKKMIHREEETKANQYWELRNLLVHGSGIYAQKLAQVSEMVRWLALMGNKYKIALRATTQSSEL